MSAELVYNDLLWESKVASNAHELRDMLGLLPQFLSTLDKDNAVAQFDKHYVRGWRSFTGFNYNKDTHMLQYPGDPPMKPVASTKLRNELILLYPYAWVAVVQPDGTSNIARLD